MLPDLQGRRSGHGPDPVPRPPVACPCCPRPGLTRLPVLAPQPPGLLLLRQLLPPPLSPGRLFLPVLVLLRDSRGP